MLPPDRDPRIRRHSRGRALVQHRRTPPVGRARVDGKVTLVETKTGKVVATTTLKGGTPGACRNVATTAILGSVPSTSEILDWMDTIK